MSSRVRQSPEDSAGSPVIWRQMHVAGPGRTGVDAGPPPDLSERLAEVQQEAEQRVREAHAAGLREGEATGRQRAATELKAAIDRLARSVEEIGGLRGRLRAEAEADLVQLSLAIAKRILRREIVLDPEALHGL